MKFARDCRSSESNEATAQLLFEALPWIKNLTGKTVVIKYGGAAMVDEQLRRDVMSDIVLLKIIGMRPVIVHGGGKAINEALSHYDIPVEFKNGQRVTTPATMDIVREVLGGKVNQELVAAINHHGNLAVGVSGSDAGTLIAEPLDPELGRVGKVTHVNTDYIERLLDSEYIPVIATVAAGEDGGFFNINADTLQHFFAEPCVIVRHLIILDKAVMLSGESVIELSQALLAETKVNMKGVKHHSVNIIGVAPVGFHDLTIDFHVHRFFLGGS